MALSEIDFGQPEAEHDSLALRNAFYEAPSWKAIRSRTRMPFVVGRKGSGKSAIVARLQLESVDKPNCHFIRFVPADFRHVEIRDLLSNLVSRNASWQYIYRKVWEGIILGQIVKAFLEISHGNNRLTPELIAELTRFKKECAFYVAALGDTLSEVLTKHVLTANKKTDALSQVELRKMIEPYDWKLLHSALVRQFEVSRQSYNFIVAIDGLDEHWDATKPSLFFLAELLAVAKEFTAKFDGCIQFVICLRDNIFRALVDTRSVEYDKIESLIINLQWDSSSLFDLIARRVSPHKKVSSALNDLRDLLPVTVSDIEIKHFLSTYILDRPRDYINFFRMLQQHCGSETQATEAHIESAIAKYCANRLIDLENEFGSIYPGISKCVTALHRLPELFDKELLVRQLDELVTTATFRSECAELVSEYGRPLVLARILISIGVIGTYDESRHIVRFIHEFSESRVVALWESVELLGFHPVYRYKKPIPVVKQSDTPAIVMHPSDYLAEQESVDDLQPFSTKVLKRRMELLASLEDISKGQPHFHKYEKWVKDVMSIVFMGELLSPETQIVATNSNKRFEIIFDIMGNTPPWPEIKTRYSTHRLLVECKNTDEPTDADFNKLLRDMDSLDLKVAFLAYRGTSREPKANILIHQRNIYINSKKEKVIIAVSDQFFKQSLGKPDKVKWRTNLRTLWRDHLERWLPT